MSYELKLLRLVTIDADIKVMSKDSTIFKIICNMRDEVYEIYARGVYQSDLHGFLEVEEYLFEEVEGQIVDPTSERLKKEFSKVRRSFIPFHLIVRIDEVDHQGVGKIRKGTKNNMEIIKMPVEFQAPIKRPEESD